MEEVLERGAATGIGSLPDTDPVQAVDRVLASAPYLPAVPSLPLRHPADSLIGEVARGISGVELIDGRLVTSGDSLAVCSVELDDDVDAGLVAFTRRLAGRRGAVKAQLVGPTTAALVLVDAGVEAQRALAMGIEVSRRRAELVLDALAASLPDSRVLLTLDEPALVTLVDGDPAFGVVEVIDAISTVLSGVEGRAHTGVHCCGPTDWPALLETGPGVVFAPLGCGLEDYSGSLAGFLDRGGWVGWGVVPTDGPVGTAADRSWKQLATTWCSLVREGCDPVRIRTQALVTPDCGLAGHGASQADRILGLVAEVSQRVHDQLVAVRFAMGA